LVEGGRGEKNNFKKPKTKSKANTESGTPSVSNGGLDCLGRSGSMDTNKGRERNQGKQKDIGGNCKESGSRETKPKDTIDGAGKKTKMSNQQERVKGRKPQTG